MIKGGVSPCPLNIRAPTPAFPHDALFWHRNLFLPEGEMRNTFCSVKDMKPYTDRPKV